MQLRSRDSVRFVKRYAAAALHLQPNLAVLQARFPGACRRCYVSTCFLMPRSPRSAVSSRLIMSLLHFGSRIVFNPNGPARSDGPPCMSLTLLLVACYSASTLPVEQQVLDDVLCIAGVIPGDRQVAFEPPICVWVGTDRT